MRKKPKPSSGRPTRGELDAAQLSRPGRRRSRLGTRASLRSEDADRARRNAAAGTTRTRRPSASRILTGAIWSSPTGSVTVPESTFMSCSSYASWGVVSDDRAKV